MSQPRSYHQPRPARDRVPSLWIAVLATVFVMLTGTLLLAMDGVRRNQEQRAERFTTGGSAEQAYDESVHLAERRSGETPP